MIEEYVDDYDEDEFFAVGCNNTDCIMIGSHFESECHTAKDLEEYLKEPL